MTKNLISDSILAHLAQIWAPKKILWVLFLVNVKYCCKLSLYAISRETYDPNLRKWQKNWFWFGLPKVFSKSLALPFARYHGKTNGKKSEKTNNPILRESSDGRTDGQTDGQARRTDGREWFYRTPSNHGTIIRTYYDSMVQMTSSIQNGK